jgi:DinB family protein
LCFHSLMRWKPEDDHCAECDFSWTIMPEDAIALVDGSPARISSTLVDADRVTERPRPGVWSPGEYLWHLVDVLRIGRERLLTISIDPAAGVPCWDENALAEVRHYDALSPPVGLIVYEGAVTEWVAVARTVPVGASVEHPVFGTLTAGDITRRNAHEVQHHELDMRRGLRATAG